ncbi:NUDIX domain-containing protein [Patescibacteria group bacterium]|nr:NUDIX domain-containing protein [Candidatus Falkowbacteria bacterium]MBU3905597.1 NUDIX domain-containing protein [Patescibacteria group bacterium]MBU4015790.1 NUDIX domain-containing protein [Patescibacteria group bacterium]MBU4026282.1 NUDIX domain-containing protein [Patescibacteria group bacterium]MBU4073068.1 NUDIX domain-containing protein [Patescibacteria group bacterium]
MKKNNIIQKIVLGAVIIKNKKILILQRSNNEKIFPGMWELPSGKREFLEPSDVSLLREVKEETRLDVEIIMPISIFDYQIKKEKEIRDSTQINFLVRPIKNGGVKLSSEHQNYAWIEKKELKKYKLSKASEDVIKKTFSLLK